MATDLWIKFHAVFERTSDLWIKFQENFGSFDRQETFTSVLCFEFGLETTENTTVFRINAQ